MGIQPNNGTIELVLNDDRDDTGQKAKPCFEVTASTPLPSDPFEPAEIGSRIHHRKCVAEYLGLGEWAISIHDGRTEFVHMGRLYRPAALFFTGFLAEYLGPLEHQCSLKLSGEDPFFGGNDHRNAPYLPESGGDILRVNVNQKRTAAAI